MSNRQVRLSVFVAMLLLGLFFFSRHYMILRNFTPSLPYQYFVLEKGGAVVKGGFASFRWRGGFPYKAGDIVTKIVAGVPGDTITVKGREFFINGVSVGVAKPYGLAGQPLEMAQPGTLGPDEYYVYATNIDSLDSRYRLTGRIHKKEFIGSAHVLF